MYKSKHMHKEGHFDELEPISIPKNKKSLAFSSIDAHEIHSLN